MMTLDQQRIVAAESVGWKLSPETDRFGNQFYERDGQWRRAGSFPKTYEPLPAYDTDLNAVSELVAALPLTEVLKGAFYESERGKFTTELERIVERDLAGMRGEKFYFDIINATAPQRLEAYLVTKGLWKP